MSSLTPALQGEAAAGLRYATFNAAANADLPEWMDFMSAFLAPDVHPELQFRARYELSIALIRGTGQSEGVDRLIRLALDYALLSHRASILDDAGTLASYWGVAWVRGVSDVSAAEIASVRDQLAEHIEAQLGLTDAQTHPVRAAALTGTLAGLAMQVRWERASVAPSRPAKRALDDLVGVRVDESAFDASILGGQGLLDLDPVMTYLERLVQLLPVARAYSVRGVARLFDMFTSVLVDYPAYEKVRDGLDEALALVDGDRAIAEKCCDRGVALFNSGKYLAALRELQLARMRWFHGESLLSSAVATRFIAELYQRLGLSYAAKMYALSAAALATQGDPPPSHPFTGPLPRRRPSSRRI